MFNEADGSFAIGVGRIAIASSDMRFVADVVNDLTLIVHAPVGEQVLRQIDTLGRPIRIVRPEPPTEPPNAWTVPDDLAAATEAGLQLGQPGDARTGTGTGSGSTIAYDPADWPSRGHAGSPSSVDVLLMMLRQAAMNAAGRSDPSRPGWGTEV